MIAAYRQHRHALGRRPHSRVGILPDVSYPRRIINISGMKNGIQPPAGPGRQCFTMRIGADAQRNRGGTIHAAMIAAAADRYCPHDRNSPRRSPSNAGACGPHADRRARYADPALSITAERRGGGIERRRRAPVRKNCHAHPRRTPACRCCSSAW